MKPPRSGHDRLTSHLPSTAGRRRSFYLRRLHSLSGVLPVGSFLVVHLWTNAHALAGRNEFDAAVGDIQRLPALWALEIFGIALPLGFHAGYGIWLSLRAQPNVTRYPYGHNWMFTLQRITGLVTLVFLAYHLWQFRLQKMFGTMSPMAFYPTLSAELSSTTAGVPLAAVAYLAGLAAVVLHFANGVWGFCVSWGITLSRRAQRLCAALCWAGGLALFALGSQTVLYFATGVRLFPAASAGQSPLPCDVGEPADEPRPGPPASATPAAMHPSR